jgi:DNA primase
MARIDYSRIDVADFLRELGLRNVQDQNTEVSYSCPFPGHSAGDSSPSATMEKGTTRAHCFGCGWSGNARTFLTDFENISPLEATRRLRVRWGSASDVEEGTVATHVGRIIEKISKTNAQPGQVILDEEEQEKRAVDWQAAATAIRLGRQVSEPEEYMLVQRGFHWQTLERWGVGYDDISQRISLPARDAYGRLVGFKARAWHPSILPKYKVLGGPEYGFEPYEVSRVLFGLHFIGAPLHLTVCEGEINAIAYDEKIKGPVVGISGKTLSNEQCALLRQYADSVDLIFDEEEDAERAALKLIKYMPVFVVPNPTNQDPAEMTWDDLSARLRMAYSATI